MNNTTNNKRYTISELEHLTKYKKRTIHYYSKNRIIPRPHGAGVGSFYSEVHLLRLNLLKHMKKSHLKLTGIKEAFDGMSIEELRDLYSRVKSENPEWKKSSLENWIVQNSESEIPLFQKTMSINESVTPYGLKSNYLENIKRKKPAITQWERIVLDDGIELQIRADKLIGKQKILEKLELIIGEIRE